MITLRMTIWINQIHFYNVKLRREKNWIVTGMRSCVLAALLNSFYDVPAVFAFGRIVRCQANFANIEWETSVAKSGHHAGARKHFVYRFWWRQIPRQPIVCHLVDTGM